MIQRPVWPWRLRISSVSMIGAPQASHGANGGEGAACTTQRVSAVLIAGSAELRSMMQVTPEDCAASVYLRLATRSN